MVKTQGKNGISCRYCPLATCSLLNEPGFRAVDHLNSCMLEMVVAVSFLSYANIVGH